MTPYTIHLKKRISIFSRSINLKGFIYIYYFHDDQKKIIKKHINETRKTIKNFFENSFFNSLSTADDEDVDKKNNLYVTIVNNKLKKGKKMIEPLLCGIVLGLVPITLLGLFVSAWNQYRRGSGMLDID